MPIYTCMHGSIYHSLMLVSNESTTDNVQDSCVFINENIYVTSKALSASPLLSHVTWILAGLELIGQVTILVHGGRPEWPGALIAKNSTRSGSMDLTCRYVEGNHPMVFLQWMHSGTKPPSGQRPQYSPYAIPVQATGNVEPGAALHCPSGTTTWLSKAESCKRSRSLYVFHQRGPKGATTLSYAPSA